jgi:hypothetical protein
MIQRFTSALFTTWEDDYTILFFSMSSIPTSG